jgi:primosomal protein N' (replication factor Y)
MFPRATVARVDPESLQAGELPPTDRDVYVTTWIGTKPTIRPDVSLVGVLDADALIRRPDFRAAEAAFEALVEMAAWAGSGGRLVVQSAESAHHAIQAVVRADYSYFLRHELAERTELGYPPASELVRIAADDAEALDDAATASREAGGRVLGPIPRRAPRAGLEILVKCPDAFAVASALRGILAARSSLRVDVDPR